MCYILIPMTQLMKSEYEAHSLSKGGSSPAITLLTKKKFLIKNWFQCHAPIVLDFTSSSYGHAIYFSEHSCVIACHALTLCTSRDSKVLFVKTIELLVSGQWKYKGISMTISSLPDDHTDIDKETCILRECPRYFVISVPWLFFFYHKWIN